MTLAEGTAGLILLSVQCLLLILAWKALRHSKAALFRLGLFEVRDALFDLAISGKVKFDDDAYTMLRDDINSMLGCAYWLSTPQILWMRLADIGKATEKQAPSQAWDRAVAAIPDAEGRDRIQHLRIHYMVLFGLHLRLLFSILTWWERMPQASSRFVAIASSLRKSVIRRATRKSSQIENARIWLETAES